MYGSRNRIRTVMVPTASGALFAIEAPAKECEDLHMLRSPLVATVSDSDGFVGKKQVLIVASRTRGRDQHVELFAVGANGGLHSLMSWGFTIESVRPLQLNDSIPAFEPSRD